MKKSLIIALFFASLMLVSGCGKNPFIEIINGNAGDSAGTILSEDFETYPAGSFTSGTGGWVIKKIYNNPAISIDQTVVKTGAKSLKIDAGSAYCTLLMWKRFNTSSKTVYAEFYMRGVEQGAFGVGLGAGNINESQYFEKMIMMAFSNYDHSSNGGYFATMVYKAAGVYGGSVVGGYFEATVSGVASTPAVWYKVKIKIDTAAKTWSLWINDAPLSGGTGTYDTINGVAANLLISIDGRDGNVYYLDGLKITEN